MTTEPTELLKSVLPRMGGTEIKEIPIQSPQHAYPTHLDTPFAQALKDHPLTKETNQ